MKLVTYTVQGRDRQIVILLEDDVAERMSRYPNLGFTCKGLVVTNPEGESVEGWVKNDETHFGHLSDEEKSANVPVTSIEVQNAKVDGRDLIVDGVRYIDISTGLSPRVWSFMHIP